MYSVIMPLYNKRDTVARAINSVLGQQDGRIVEIVVVDDGSTDGSDEIAAGFGERIRLYRQANAGPAAARNHAVRLSTQERIVLLDADDELLPGYFEAMDEAAKPNVPLVLPGHIGFRDGKAFRECGMSERAGKADQNISLTNPFPGAVIGVGTTGICMSRRLFDAIGGFDEELRCWEVTDLLYRAALQRNPVCLMAGKWVAVHTIDDNSQFNVSSSHSKYLQRFVLKMLDGLETIKPEYRKIFLQELWRFAYALWNKGDIRALKRIAPGLRNTSREFDVGGRMYTICALPAPVLYLAWNIRRLLHRQIAIGPQHRI